MTRNPYGEHLNNDSDEAAKPFTDADGNMNLAELRVLL